MNLKPWLQSSQSPDQVSHTVRGAIVAATGIIIFVAQWLNVPLTETDVMVGAANFGTAIGALWALYGLLMKIVMRIGMN